MKVDEELIRYAQRRLGAKDDGIIGKQTIGLLERKIAVVSSIHPLWDVKRKLVAYVQFLALSRGLEAGKIDGYYGPQTEYALEQLLYVEKFHLLPPKWRDGVEELPIERKKGRQFNPHGFPKYSEIENYYGKPGSSLCLLELPFPMRLAWNKAKIVKRITCHEKVKGSLGGILEDLLDHYGYQKIKKLGIDLFGGVYNERKMRGGKKLSTHSWGVAIDLDPERNRLRWDRDRAQFAKSEYRFLLEAFAAEGWVSLGEAKDYDWMHFQAVRI